MSSCFVLGQVDKPNSRRGKMDVFVGRKWSATEDINRYQRTIGDPEIYIFFSGKVNLYCCWSGYNHLIRHHLNEGESDGREQTEWELWTARGDCWIAECACFDGCTYTHMYAMGQWASHEWSNNCIKIIGSFGHSDAACFTRHQTVYAVWANARTANARTKW